MRFMKYFLITLALLVIVLTVNMYRLSIKDIEKMTIEKALSIALIDEKIPDYGLLKNPKKTILLKDNIDIDLIPKLKGIDLIVLSSEEIEKIANIEGDFLYLKISDISASRTKSKVSVENIWAVSQKSKATGTLHASGGGFALTFYNIGGILIESAERSEWIS